MRISIILTFSFLSVLFAQTKLGSDIDGEAARDQSGNSVSLNSAGDRVAIGAPENDGTGTNAGHVRIYEYSGGSWSQLGSDIDGEANDDLSGYSVSLNSDGDRVAIGAYYNDGTGTSAGHVRVYQYKTLTEAEFAAGNTTNTTSATGDPIIVDGGENWDADTKFWIQLGSDIDG
ncbi:MAG TPA: hypothetical protein QGF40_02040, partial [Candidatus Marinimicrobia bacterium]|nr:hypothetical protein [Candidatus Neomarinimicrobiota bacterium]